MRIHRIQVERIIEKSKEYRRTRAHRILVPFFGVLFVSVVIFTTSLMSVEELSDATVKTRVSANGSSDQYQDIRYTFVNGEMQKEYLSEEEVKAEEEKEKAEKEAEEKAKQAAQNSVAQVDTYVPPQGAKIVYLTFDDGPGPDTGRLLDVLKKYNVKATFFVTCNRAQYRNMITRAFNEGHSIGLHSCSHNYASVYANDGAFYGEMQSISDVVKSLTGNETKLFRFPGGSSNTVSAKYSKGIMSRVAPEMEKRGYAYFDWNVSSGDAGGATTAGQVYNNVTRALRGDYSIVLQHDIKGFSVDAVEDIIKFGQKYGFTFKALDLSSPTAHHRISN